MEYVLFVCLVDSVPLNRSLQFEVQPWVVRATQPVANAHSHCLDYSLMLGTL